MKYEKIKSKIDDIIAGRGLLRKIFYSGLNLFLLRAWYVRDEIKEFFKARNENDKITVLDAGCGFGQYSYFIARKFKNTNVIGVDINERRIRDCEEFSKREEIKNLKFEVADLVKLNHSDRFDLILAVDVMEHIGDDISVFENFYKAMRKNSLLIISTPSNFSDSDEEENFIEEHVRHGYDVAEIISKLEKAGFKDVKVKYTYGKWGSLSWQLMIKIPVLLLGRSFIFVLFLPLYYFVAFVPGIFLMWLDKKTKNLKGTGLIVTAKK